MLEGMDRRRDGHAWTETATTNIMDPDGQLSFGMLSALVTFDVKISLALIRSVVGSTTKSSGRVLLLRC